MYNILFLFIGIMILIIYYAKKIRADFYETTLLSVWARPVKTEHLLQLKLASYSSENNYSAWYFQVVTLTKLRTAHYFGSYILNTCQFYRKPKNILIFHITS